MTAEATELTVAIDTREQLPYAFPRSEVLTLATGDYSAVGFQDKVTVERKSKADLYQSLGKGRDRFERELARMAHMDVAAIVIESSLPELLIPPPRTQMSPTSVVNSIIAWSIKYRVQVYFADDRDHGTALVWRLLECYLRYYVDKRATWAEAPKTTTSFGEHGILFNPASGQQIAVTKLSSVYEISIEGGQTIITPEEYAHWVTTQARHTIPRKEPAR